MSFDFNQMLSNRYVQIVLGVLAFVLLTSLTGVCSGPDDAVVANTTNNEINKDFHTVSSKETIDDNKDLEIIVEPKTNKDH